MSDPTTENSAPLTSDDEEALTEQAATEPDAPEDDESRSPEEENASRIPGDPRPNNEQQPPTKDQY